MQPARFGVEPLSLQALGHRRGEGDNVVLHLRLNLLDACGGATRLGGNGLSRRGGNHPILGQYCARSRLHLQPAAVFVLFRPDAAHRRPCIAFDQGVTPREGCFSPPIPTPDCTGGMSGCRILSTAACGKGGLPRTRTSNPQSRGSPSRSCSSSSSSPRPAL